MLISIDFLKKDANEEDAENAVTLPVSFDLLRYFAGESIDFSKYKVSLSGLTPFEQRVLEETRNIKYGQNLTYAELAAQIGSRAYRAVGNALGKNPLPIVIPCHRIVASHGLGGYSGGLEIKKKLLELEIAGLYH